eukprot:TRINITY_DN60655_c0_g1_i1.p1 TRINITY_DN60655_c0_g1~~TRINITY_DN60655_c0_g1_i1.p1  ORF type:complete len:314 (+),score=61.65 TRINITY_DN60655_c0_g1_i1:94-1035(+)
MKHGAPHAPALAALAAAAAAHNLRVPVPRAYVPHLYSNEDTRSVTPDLIEELLLSCTDSVLVNRPVFCEIETRDRCGNPEGAPLNETAFATDVRLVAGDPFRSADLVSAVVHKGGGQGVNKYRFYFTPTVVGVFRVSVSVTADAYNVSALPSIGLHAPPVLVVVGDYTRSCAEMPRVRQSREWLESLHRYTDLDEPFRNWRVPPQPQWHTHTDYAPWEGVERDRRAAELQELAARGAALQNRLQGVAQGERTSHLPDTHLRLHQRHQLESLVAVVPHVLPQNLFHHQAPPPDSFPPARDAFCQTVERQSPDGW